MVLRSCGAVPGLKARKLDFDFGDEYILAVGGDVKNRFLIARGNEVFWGNESVDLQNPAILSGLESQLEEISEEFPPSVIVSDMHPGYYSTRLAEELSQELSIPHFKVQHHHAHVCAMLALENEEKEAIGISFDGTGFGTDSNIWGGEFLTCDFRAFERAAHYEYIPLPGGEKAILEPWRTAFSYLREIFGERLWGLEIDFLKYIDREKAVFVGKALRNRINSPLTSSAGRLFDAVSALIGLCREARHEAEAAMLLEEEAERSRNDLIEPYAFELIKKEEDVYQISFRKLFIQLIEDLKAKKEPAVISARFHAAMVDTAVETSEKLREERGINTVVLSGGCFQNKILLKGSRDKLLKRKFKVIGDERMPLSDVGIALGQAAVASRRIR